MFSQNQELIQAITDLNNAKEEAEEDVKKLSREYDNLDVEDAKIRGAKNKKVAEISKMHKQIEVFKKDKQQLTDRCTEIEVQNPEIEKRLKKVKGDHDKCDQVFQLKDVEVRKQTESLRHEKEKFEGPYNQI